MIRRRTVAFLGGAVLLTGVGAMLAAGPRTTPEIEGEHFGVLSSLPIYRAPQASVADALSRSERAGSGHWLRTAIQNHNTLTPVDLLDPESLEQLDILLLIQPRALTPAENVALDDWVRAGGQVLLVADPMLVGEPHFALGDPRNPQAIALTGPIQARWGLTLQSGTSGDEGERMIDLEGARLPVALGGAFTLRPPEGGDPADCTLRERGLVAVCRIGDGRALLLADATLFEADTTSAKEQAALWTLLGIMRDDPV